eukprot:11686677-Karenia_brevis.AAC.1
MEQKMRTLKFTGFKQDTEEVEIKRVIQEKLNEGEVPVEEVFAYGKFSNAGGARLKDDASMWQYLEDNQGNLNFEYQSGRIYISPVDDGKPEHERVKAKAVR